MPLVEVRLLGLPIRLLVASQEHHDALLREFRLIALADQSAHPVPRDLAALVEEFGVRYATARGRRDREIQEALRAGLIQIDQVFQVPAAAADEMRYVGALLRQADRYCLDNPLLTLARPLLVKRFSDWYRGQIVDQIMGRPPTPWEGPLTLE